MPSTGGIPPGPGDSGVPGGENGSDSDGAGTTMDPSGTTGDADDGADDGGASFVVTAGTDGPGEPGTYPACNFDDPNNLCPPGEMCLGLSNPGPAACAAPCAASPECPTGPEGTATPRCLLDTNADMMGDHCSLGCDPAGADCPGGMSCHAVGGAPDGGVCLWG